MNPRNPCRTGAFANAGRKRRLARWAAGAALLLAGASPVAGQGASEYQVKAAFLLNFTKFIEWPPSAFAAPDAPLTICVLGEDPFGPALDEIVSGETVNGRRLAVTRIRRLQGESCQVLYMALPDSRALPTVPPATLTVGDGDNFVKRGGMIGFIVENRRVRFDVDLAQAVKSGLKVSSRLLAVARSVRQ